MNDAKLNAMMQLVPERYLDEAMDYHEAHAPKETAVPFAEKQTVPRRMLWIAAPVSAAACLAAVVGLVYFIGIRQPERPVESLENAVVEEQRSAGTVTTASETVTTAAGTDAQRSTTAKTHTEARAAAVTVTSIVSGRAAETATSAETAESSAGTAKPSSAAAANTEAAAQTETEPRPTIAGRPYDPEIVAQYQLGDVNMDGVIGMDDYQLMWYEYNAVVMDGGESLLTAEQLVLADLVRDNRVPLCNDAMTDFGYMTSVIQMDIPTDHPVSYADMAVFLDYFTSCIVANNKPWRSLEEEGARGRIEHDFSADTAPLDPHYGWRYTDASEECVFLPELGTIPVHNEDLFLYAYASYAGDGRFISRLYYTSGAQYVFVTAEPDNGIRPEKTPLSAALPEQEMTVDVWLKNMSVPTAVWYHDGKCYRAYCYQFDSDEAITELLPRLIGSLIPE